MQHLSIDQLCHKLCLSMTDLVITTQLGNKVYFSAEEGDARQAVTSAKSEDQQIRRSAKSDTSVVSRSDWSEDLRVCEAMQLLVANNQPGAPWTAACKR
jgi:hypothetical protein